MRIELLYDCTAVRGDIMILDDIRKYSNKDLGSGGGFLYGDDFDGLYIMLNYGSGDTGYIRRFKNGFRVISIWIIESVIDDIFRYHMDGAGNGLVSIGNGGGKEIVGLGRCVRKIK